MLEGLAPAAQHLGFVTSQLATPFELIGSGALLARWKVLDTSAVEGLTRYTLWLSFPALLIARLGAARGLDFRSVGWVAAYAAALVVPYLVTAQLGRLLRWSPRSTSAMSLAAGAPNDAFLGAPLVLAALGAPAVSSLGVLLAVNWGLVFPLAVATARFYTVPTRSPGLFLAGLLSPMTVGAGVGVALMLIGGPVLPAPLASIVTTLSASSSPVALVALGASVMGKAAGAPVPEARSLPLVAMIRLLIAPLTTFTLLSAVPCPDVVREGAILLCACPTALGAFLQARRLAPPAHGAALMTLGTTLASAITLPVWWLVLRPS